MTTVTVELPFELTREHMLLLHAAERCKARSRAVRFFQPGVQPGELFVLGADLFDAGMMQVRHDTDALVLMPLGRAILAQCPSLWEPDELETKLREMAE